MSDLASLALEGLVTLGSAGAGVLALTWRLSSQIQAFKARLERAEAQLAVAELRAAKAELDFDTFVREENEHWQTLNRTLGQIEGAMTGPRPPTRSRP
jgi:hypothetical protein